MDPIDNFAQKKKKDLVAIATLFGLISEEKAIRMTKQDLLDLLKEQERMSRDANASEETIEEKAAPILEPVTEEAMISEPQPLKSTLPVEAAESVATPITAEVTSSAMTDSTLQVTAPKPSRSKSNRGPSSRKGSSVTEIEAKQTTKTDTKKRVTSGSRKKSKPETVTPSEGSDSFDPAKNEQAPVESEIITTDSIPTTYTPASEALTMTTSAFATDNLTPIVGESPAPVESTPLTLTENVVSTEPVIRQAEHNRPKRRSVIIVPKEERMAEARPYIQDASPEIISDAEATGAETPPVEAVSHPVKSHKPKEPTLELLTGVLEIVQDGSYGFLRRENYLQGQNDVYVASNYIRRFNLRVGDLVTGYCRPKRDTDRYPAIQFIKEVNGDAPEKMVRRPNFDRLTPIYPDQKYTLETEKNELSTRIIDLIAPIGKGQRGMIVSPPKAGKTILLQKIANAISINNPDSKLIVLLIDERPEEVTDMQRSINGEVVYSTFDKTPENHCKITELVLERAMRLVELGQDVVILLDSITRLSRAYNLTINPTGRTLSGGLDPGALYGPKRFFGAARNIENGGSLTIIATSLIDTGSRMDEVIFEEFKGTGNMEVYLDRKLSEKRIFPAIDINKSGTRREELLLSQLELDAVWTIRKAFGQLDTAAVTEMIISLLLKTTGNQQFVQSVNVSFNDKATFEAMRGTRLGGNGTPGGAPQGGK